MLEFDNVSKSFWTGTQHKVILDHVSFRVDLGHSLGILAPNGTGKTTLINMMAGLEKPEFDLNHVTLELETQDSHCHDAKVIGH